MALTIKQLKFAREIEATHWCSRYGYLTYYRNITADGGYQYLLESESSAGWCDGAGGFPVGWNRGEVHEIDFSPLDDYYADKALDIAATGGDQDEKICVYTKYSPATYSAMIDAGYECNAGFDPYQDWHIGYDVDSKTITSYNPKIHSSPVSFEEFVKGMPNYAEVAEVHGKSNQRSKYHREVKPGVWIDVYDVIKAWGVNNPAQQHLIKKALQAGDRGHKDYDEDMDDVIASAKRAKDLQK